MAFARVEQALREVRAGRMVILVDDEGRENEGDLCLAADCTLPADINFMVTHGRGLVCLPLAPSRIEALGLPMMVQHNSSSFGTAFTVSIEAASGVTTGISAFDRAHTIRTAIGEHARPSDLARPGHVFPLRARTHGVLARDGQTEGSVDLARLAGRAPGAVICEVLGADGTMARLPELIALAERHGLAIVSVAELIAYRLATEPLLLPQASRQLAHPQFGTLTLTAFSATFDARQHLLIARGFPAPAASALPAAPAPLAIVEAPDAPALSAAPAGSWPSWLRAAEPALAAPQAAVVVCTAPQAAPVPLIAWLESWPKAAAAAQAKAAPLGQAGGPAPATLHPPTAPASPRSGVRGIAGSQAQHRWRMGVAGQLFKTLPGLIGRLTGGDEADGEALGAAGVALAQGGEPGHETLGHAQAAPAMVWPGPAAFVRPKYSPQRQGPS